MGHHVAELEHGRQPVAPNDGTLGAYFASGGTGTITVSSGIQAAGITFDVGATDTLTGGGLTLGSGGITAYETATINTPITLGIGQTWSIDLGKTLTVGAISGGSSYALTKAGAGTLTFGPPAAIAAARPSRAAC